MVKYPCMTKDGYEVMQVITDRRNSYYTTYILIRNVCDLLGRNTYTCEVENYAGSRSRNIYTKMEGMIIILRFNIYIIYICSRQVCVCQHTYYSQNICWCIYQIMLLTQGSILELNYVFDTLCVLIVFIMHCTPITYQPSCVQ